MLAEQVRDGFLYVGPIGAPLVCRYDPPVADVERWQRELTGRLGAVDAGLVQQVPVRRPQAELVAIERVLLDASWHRTPARLAACSASTGSERSSR